MQHRWYATSKSACLVLLVLVGGCSDEAKTNGGPDENLTAPPQKQSIPTDDELADLGRQVRELIAAMDPIVIQDPGPFDPGELADHGELHDLFGMSQLADHYDQFLASYRSVTKPITSPWKEDLHKLSRKVSILIEEPEQVDGFQAIRGLDKASRKRVAVMTTHQPFDRFGNSIPFKSKACALVPSVNGKTVLGEDDTSVLIFEDLSALELRVRSFQKKMDSLFERAQADYDKQRSKSAGWVVGYANELVSHVYQKATDPYRAKVERHITDFDRASDRMQVASILEKRDFAHTAEVAAKGIEWAGPYLAAMSELPVPTVQEKVSLLRSGLEGVFGEIRQSIASAEYLRASKVVLREKAAKRMVSRLMRGAELDVAHSFEGGYVDGEVGRTTCQVSWKTYDFLGNKVTPTFHEHCTVEPLDGSRVRISFDYEWCVENL